MVYRQPAALTESACAFIMANRLPTSTTRTRRRRIFIWHLCFPSVELPIFIFRKGMSDVIGTLRSHLNGPIIAGGELTRKSENVSVASGRIDFAAFGRAFLANPDLIERFRNGWTINRPDPQTYYSQGMRGYNDYPTFSKMAE
jgi:2,4-dienoyl-CoA reductase-like NADH-dependent reductase (Old Yellow Enzyme family)